MIDISKELDKLRQENLALKLENAKLKMKLDAYTELHNEGGILDGVHIDVAGGDGVDMGTMIHEDYAPVGRPVKFDEATKTMIIMYRMQGKTIQELSEMYDCSVGLIHKIIKDAN